MTPQQANELLPCPFCGSSNIDPAEWSGNDGASGPGCDDCGALAETVEDWNRRAPAPTEPAVDRDAVGEPWLDTLRELVSDFRKAAFEFGKGLDPDDHALMMERQGQIFAHARALVTPASPAVPAGFALVPIEPTQEMLDEIYRGNYPHIARIYARMLAAAPTVPAPAPLAPKPAMSKFATMDDYRAAIESFDKRMADPLTRIIMEQTGNLPAAPQVPQASQPTSARDVMAGYTPKPLPPRPQRPVGAPWTDTEREEYRKNMKRGERCPVCSVIEGGQHFSGCSRGKP